MSFTKLKAKGSGQRLRADLSKVSYFVELESGTELNFDNGFTVVVEDSFQTVSNRAAAVKAESADEVPAAPVA